MAEGATRVSGSGRQMRMAFKSQRRCRAPQQEKPYDNSIRNTPAGVMELVDVVDSKSTDGDIVPVRVRPPAPKIGDPRQRVADFTYSLFTIHSSLKIKADFWKVISNSE